MTDRFGPAERVADAVMYEGYVLYPYRASAAKNRMRWQFGVVAPRPPRDEEGEPRFSQTEVLVEDASARLRIRVKCLRPRRERADWLDAAPQAIDLDELDLGKPSLMREIVHRIADVDLRGRCWSEIARAGI